MYVVWAQMPLQDLTLPLPGQLVKHLPEVATYLAVEHFPTALRTGAEVFHTLKKVLAKKGCSTAVGDEGGFAPRLATNEEALEVIMDAIKKAGYKPGKDIAIALDPAASEMFDSKTKTYRFFKSAPKKKISSDTLIKHWVQWVDKYPIVSIEDGLAEDDWAGWSKLNKKLGRIEQKTRASGPIGWR